MIKFKITVKILMAATLIMGVALTILSKELLKRRSEYLHEYTYHARRETEELQNLAAFEARRVNTANSNDPSFAKMEKSSRLRAGYHAELKLRYQSAATYPWQSIGTIPKDPGEDLIWDSLLDIPSPSFSL